MGILRRVFRRKNKKQIPRTDGFLYRDLLKNITNIKADFEQNDDLIVNSFKWSDNQDTICASLYIKTLVNTETINSLSEEISILKMKENKSRQALPLDVLRAHFSGVRTLKEGDRYIDLYADLLSGNTVFLLHGSSQYLSIPTESTEGRSVEEPSSQTVIRGPKEGFTENINQNIMLVRKRIKSNALSLESLSLGNLTRTDVGLMYIKNIAKDSMVREIQGRIKRIETDSILEGAYIEEWIKDDRYSIFPTFLSSEKPDSVAAALLEGKVAIFTDGTPYVLTAPALMVEFFHSSEDYYHHYIIATMMRILRFFAFFLTLLIPSFYIAIATFHQEILPTPLLISIAAQREGVPFPTFLEALIMENTFEILREAGIRMPRAIGPAISIVGALVLGQAAVDAGIISNVIVIIVSITAISSFAIPNYEMSNAVRTTRFAFMVLAGVTGLYGVFIGIIILTLHLCKLKSIGVPYLTPIAPWIKDGNVDTFFRFPFWAMKNRPFGLHGDDKRRIGGEYPVRKNKKGNQEFR